LADEKPREPQIPYFTPSDIEKGTRWSTDIAKELEESSVGILCVTQDNLHSDWILFEAGALSKRLQKSHVCPILFGITNTDLAGPLKQFQTTEFEKTDFSKLLGVINAQLGDHKLPPKTLELVFDKWWPDLEVKIQEILKDVQKADQPIRSDRELLEEILLLNRDSVRRNLRPTIPSRAIVELLQGFIRLHNEQSNAVGGYQEALDTLNMIKKPLEFIASKYAGSSEQFDSLMGEFSGLSFRTVRNEQGADEDSDDIPF
jgi:hypothetical protein